MKTMRIETECSYFTSCDEQLVCWKTHGYSTDDEDKSRNWQFQSDVIATIPEAEAFAQKLGAAIAGAKARLALANESRDAAKPSTETQPEDEA